MIPLRVKDWKLMQYLKTDQLQLKILDIYVIKKWFLGVTARGLEKVLGLSKP